MPGRRLGALRSDEAAAAIAAGEVVLVPVGAFEQHGPHLPLDVDINLAETVARGVVESVDRTLLAPSVAWGLSASHMGFPGTITLGVHTMLALLADIGGSLAAHGFRKIVFVAFHMSNRALVTIAVRELWQAHSVAALHLFCSDLAADVFREHRTTPLGGEMHAGEFETSVELYLRPDLVRMDRAVRNPLDPAAHFGLASAPADMFSPGMAQTGIDLCAAAPDGVLGDPTTASTELGGRLVDAMVSRAAAIVTEYRDAPFESEDAQ